MCSSTRAGIKLGQLTRFRFARHSIGSGFSHSDGKATIKLSSKDDFQPPRIFLFSLSFRFLSFTKDWR